MLRPKALDHVGLKVGDIERSLRFYCEGLGLELLRRSDHGGGAASAVIRVGDQEINLFAHADFASAGSPNHQPIDHFCLTVDNPTIADLVAALEQAGIAIASGPVARRDGMALFVADPDGVRVELQIKR
jgi:catechol 2,3-dioxygenase-like lactoylglutathione lyase family enzyme